MITSSDKSTLGNTLYFVYYVLCIMYVIFFIQYMLLRIPEKGLEKYTFFLKQIIDFAKNNKSKFYENKHFSIDHLAKILVDVTPLLLSISNYKIRTIIKTMKVKQRNNFCIII